MREILLLTVVYGSLPFALVSPFFGLLVFSWLAYMRPHDYAWLTGPERLSLWVAIAMLVGLLFHLGRERIAVIRPQTVLLGILAVWFAVTGFTAVSTYVSMPLVEQFSKVILVAILTTGLVTTRRRFRILMLVVTFSLGLLGLKFGLFGLVRGGTTINQGPGGFMSDNNDLALAFAMTVPLLAAVAASDESRWVRIAASAMIPFTVLSIIFTFSRGGLLTLGVVGLLVIVRSGRPFLAVLLVVISLIGFTTFTSERFQASYRLRTESISSYEEDPSATGRLAAWQTAWRMSQDYPVFGVGPGNFRQIYRQYGEPGETVRVTHNAYLQFLSECGWPTVFLYAALMVMPLWTLERLRHTYKQPRLSAYASGIQISIIGYSVGSLFLDMAYFDLFYHLVAMSVCLETVAALGDEPQPTEEPVEPSGDIPWWKQAPAPRAGS